ncbi:MAG: HlyD family efflux transporter periplasmic adaptor subunit [Bacteroidetes bacterium]|nr:MAG: HlyD family efflux transporter periplasmic adaptor subunit [Bacteroidota bacterium]
MRTVNLDGNIEARLPESFKSFPLIYESNRKNYRSRIFWTIVLVFVGFLFLPWTQNIRSKGFVTTLYQNQRPQELNSQIPGKILKWYVKEGDYVNVGDTILQLGEVKDDYLDPLIIPRTQTQIAQNRDKARFYEGKIATAGQQISNLEQQRELKVSSLQNKLVQINRKIEAKKAELTAANIDVKQFGDQLTRAKTMLAEGAISQFEFERRNAGYQKALAIATEKQNDLGNLQQDLVINKLDLNNAVQEYGEKIAKAQGDQFASSSEIAGANEKVASLEIKKQNITNRSGFYYLVAPQSGQVIHAAKSGINEIIKEGEKIVEIVPSEIKYAAELFIEPMDLPLIDTGRKVRFMFDGFPAIVFSGWPAASYGTFGGKVVAVETNRSVNGKFRILVTEDPNDRPWPKNMKLGAGAQGFALLKDVQIWYELWRNINGFPPDFYATEEPKKAKK